MYKLNSYEKRRVQFLQIETPAIPTNKDVRKIRTETLVRTIASKVDLMKFKYKIKIYNDFFLIFLSFSFHWLC